MYPLEKYQYFTDGKSKVYAVSSYAGRTIRGMASLNPEDTFDLEKGKKLAALRCAVKIADKRIKRADSKLYAAEVMAAQAENHLEDMQAYFKNALLEKFEIESAMEALLKEM